MKRLLIIVSFILLPLVSQVASQIPPQVILDVRAEGLELEPVGAHIYIRVYDDGTIEYEDYKNSIRAFYLRESRLTSEQLQSLRELLKNTEIQKIADTYVITYPMKEVAKHIQITITHHEGFKVINIDSRDTTATKKTAYPQELKDILCRVEELRGNAVVRLIEKGECKR